MNIKRKGSTMNYEIPTVEELVIKLKGRSCPLRPSKPTNENGLVKYMWRECRWVSGQDPRLPIMAYFELCQWFDENGIQYSYGRKTAIQEEIENKLNNLAVEVVEKMGLDKHGLAKRWKGLI